VSNLDARYIRRVTSCIFFHNDIIEMLHISLEGLFFSKKSFFLHARLEGLFLKNLFFLHARLEGLFF
jgi:hypothetical protein